MRLGDLLRFLKVLVFLRLPLNTLKFKINRAVSALGAVLLRCLQIQDSSTVWFVLKSHLGFQGLFLSTVKTRDT